MLLLLLLLQLLLLLLLVLLILYVYYGIILASVNICSFSLSFWEFLTVFSVSCCVFSFYVASGVTVTTVTTLTTGTNINTLREAAPEEKAQK